jgi:hypothetical protein
MTAREYLEQAPIGKDAKRFTRDDMIKFAAAFHLNELERILKELKDFQNTKQNETT